MMDDIDRKIERLIGNLRMPPTLSELHDARAKLPEGMPAGRDYRLPRFSNAIYPLTAAHAGLPMRGHDIMEFRLIENEDGRWWAYHGDVLCVPFTEEQLRAMVAEREDKDAARRNAHYLRLLAENMHLRLALQEAGVPLPQKVQEMDEEGRRHSR